MVLVYNMSNVISHFSITVHLVIMFFLNDHNHNLFLTLKYMKWLKINILKCFGFPISR